MRSAVAQPCALLHDQLRVYESSTIRVLGLEAPRSPGAIRSKTGHRGRQTFTEGDVVIPRNHRGELSAFALH